MSSIALGRPASLPFLRLPFVVAFAAAALAAGLGRAVTTTYLPLLLERINDAPGLIGMVMLVNAAAGMAVPLVVGLWSDRLGRSGHGRRLPFILGGAVVTAGGLLAIALGSSSSYLVLALSAAVVYTGLNAVTTAHRALIPETFDASGRPKATSAQELAMLVGGLLGLAVGGALTGLALWAPFALSAILVPLLALPTLRRVTEPEEHAPAEATSPSRPTGYYLRAAARPGVRGFLLAQILWVLGCRASRLLPPLRGGGARARRRRRLALARRVRARDGMGIVLAGRVKNPALHRPLLLAGIVLLGGGFLGVGLSTSLVPVGAALVLGAAGFGLVSTLGFPLFSAMIPEREAGAYTALYFSVRSISSTIALPAAGWTVQATGSYRSLFLLGGIATMTALVPLLGLPRVKAGSASRSACSLSSPCSGCSSPRPRRTASTNGSTARSTGSARAPRSLDDPRPAHAQLPRLDRHRPRRRCGHEPAQRARDVRSRARLGAPRVGPARGRLLRVRPAAPRGGRRRPEPERPPWAH